MTVKLYFVYLLSWVDTLSGLNTDRDPRIKCNDQTIRSLEGEQKSNQVSSTVPSINPGNAIIYNRHPIDNKLLARD